MLPDIRDIKGVIGVFDLLSFLFLCVCLVFFLFLVFFVYKYWQKRQRDRANLLADLEAKGQEKNFQQLAEEAILKLDPLAYYEKGRIKEFVFEVTEIIKAFLAGNYLIDTLDKTSFEMITEIERVERDYNKVKNLDSFFQNCDLVKFAKARPALAEMREIKSVSLRIIKEYFKPNVVR